MGLIDNIQRGVSSLLSFQGHHCQGTSDLWCAVPDWPPKPAPGWTWLSYTATREGHPNTHLQCHWGRCVPEGRTGGGTVEERPSPREHGLPPSPLPFPQLGASRHPPSSPSSLQEPRGLGVWVQTQWRQTRWGSRLHFLLGMQATGQPPLLPSHPPTPSVAETSEENPHCLDTTLWQKPVTVAASVARASPSHTGCPPASPARNQGLSGPRKSTPVQETGAAAARHELLPPPHPPPGNMSGGAKCHCSLSSQDPLTHVSPGPAPPPPRVGRRQPHGVSESRALKTAGSPRPVAPHPESSMTAPGPLCPPTPLPSVTSARKSSCVQAIVFFFIYLLQN